mmetsp:Transcript_13318/g.37493  ORF Transcript_13318/g.37493 Transcript_13318/m.37493 type:complete len:233 (-) Transcript_13318:338-1036(-)
MMIGSSSGESAARCVSFCASNHPRTARSGPLLPCAHKSAPTVDPSPKAIEQQKAMIASVTNSERTTTGGPSADTDAGALLVCLSRCRRLLLWNRVASTRRIDTTIARRILHARSVGTTHWYSASRSSREDVASTTLRRSSATMIPCCRRIPSRCSLFSLASVLSSSFSLFSLLLLLLLLLLFQRSTSLCRAFAKDPESSSFTGSRVRSQAALVVRTRSRTASSRSFAIWVPL